MAVFERETTVRTPLETVWAFHSTVDGLAALTPDWLHLQVHAIEGPDRESRQDVRDGASSVLEAGSTVDLSVRPFGRGPRQHWRSEILTRRREAGAALFRDRMVEGPFDEWVHTHAFYAADGGTRIRDRVEYALSAAPLGGIVDRFAVAGLAPTFRYRHRRTRELLAEGDWDGWD